MIVGLMIIIDELMIFFLFEMMIFFVYEIIIFFLVFVVLDLFLFLSLLSTPPTRTAESTISNVLDPDASIF